MNNMDKQYIEQHGIVGKYLQGQLTGEEVMAFEEYLMEHPELVEQLELDLLMTKAMPAAFSQLQQSQPSEKPGFWWWLKNPLVASFATLLLCVLCLPLFYAQDERAVIANIQQVYLAPVRGESMTEQVPVIAISQNDVYFELTVQPGGYSATQYEIQIVNRSSSKVLLPATQFDVMPSGDIKLLLNTKPYAPGAYQLVAKPFGNSEESEAFYFNVVLTQ